MNWQLPRNYIKFNVFMAFSLKIVDQHMFSCSGVRVREVFSVISFFLKCDFFSQVQISISKQDIKSTLRFKNYFYFTKLEN